VLPQIKSPFRPAGAAFILGVSLALSLVTVIPAGAMVTSVGVIDDFTMGPQILDLTGGTGVSAGSAMGDPDNILGEERDVVLTVTENPPSPIRTAFAQLDNMGSNILNISFGPNVAGMVSLTYNGEDDMGLGGFNLEAEGATMFAIDVLFSDALFDIIVRVVDTDTNEAIRTYSQISTIGGMGKILQIDYNSFSGSADFTIADSVSFEIAPSSPGFDFTADRIFRAIPEPSSVMLLIGSGLLMVVRHRRTGSGKRS
jgi:hypothetical protein